MFNDCGCGIKNGLRGAIIFLETNNLGIGEIFGEAFQVSSARASPSVNGLVFIAYHADVLLSSGEQPHDFFLRVISILKFVNHQVLKPGVPGFANFAMLAQKLHGAQQQVVKIQGVGVSQHRFICAENCGDVFAVRVARSFRFRFHIVGGNAVIFGMADLCADAAWRIVFRRESQLIHGPFYRSFLVVVIVDGEIAREGPGSLLHGAAVARRRNGMWRPKHRKHHVRWNATAR